MFSGICSQALLLNSLGELRLHTIQAHGSATPNYTERTLCEAVTSETPSDVTNTECQQKMLSATEQFRWRAMSTSPLLTAAKHSSCNKKRGQRTPLLQSSTSLDHS